MTAATTDPAPEIPGIGPITDLYTYFYPSSAKDDLFTFAGNGRVTVDNGPGKCSPSEPQTAEGSWRLSEDQSELIITAAPLHEGFPSGTLTFTIEELTPTTLRVVYFFPMNGVTYTTRETYSAQ